MQPIAVDTRRSCPEGARLKMVGKKLKCNPGNYQCGGRCLPSTLKCRKEANEEARKAAADLRAIIEKAEVAGSTKARETIQEVSNRFGGDPIQTANEIRLRIERARRAKQTPDQRAKTDAQKVFQGNAPDYLQKVVDAVGGPPGGIVNDPNNKTDTSNYSPKKGVLSMYGREVGSADYNSVLKHEYTHHLDFTIRNKTQGILEEGENPLMISSSKRYQRAMDLDRETLLESAGKLAIDKDKENQAIRDIQSNPRLKKFANQQLRAGRSRNQILRDSHHFAEVKRWRDSSPEDQIRIIKEKRDPLGNSLGGRMLDSLENQGAIDTTKKLTFLNNLTFNPNDPETLSEMAGLLAGGEKAAGQALDLIGATTSNAVGSGHTADYYAKSSLRRGAESFAQMGALLSGNNTQNRDMVEEYMREVMPNTFEAFEEIMRSVR